jgi:hypothetical protein
MGLSWNVETLKDSIGVNENLHLPKFRPIALINFEEFCFDFLVNVQPKIGSVEIVQIVHRSLDSRARKGYD